MKLDVLSISGQKTGRSVDLDDTIFGLEPNEHAMYLAVKQYLANQRQGTHSTLEKSQVSGSTKKLHKQKGTGGARKGSIKAPHFYGGARAFGPHPRDYSFKLNAKIKDLARRSALSAKAKTEGLTIIEDIKLNDHKTSAFNNILKSLGVVGTKTLVVLPEFDANIARASRNIERAKVTRASDLNTYEILNCRKLVLCESAVNKIGASK